MIVEVRNVLTPKSRKKRSAVHFDVDMVNIIVINFSMFGTKSCKNNSFYNKSIAFNTDNILNHLDLVISNIILRCNSNIASSKSEP